MRINVKMNKVLFFIVSVLTVAVSTDDPCSNENLIFSRENFEVYRDNIDAVNLGLPICSKIPNYNDQIKLTISVTTLSGVINLNVSDNIQSLIIDKRSGMNITIDATNVINIDRLELRSQANWFLLNTSTDFFSEFPRLTHLVAENIILRDLPSFALRNPALTRIQVLKSNFTDSDYVQVNRAFVSGLSGLRVLWWKNSEIANLSSDAFDGLSALTELNLENNTLMNINPDQFENTSLLELDLSHNELTTERVENNAFRGLSNLTYLAINSNSNFAPSILFHPLNSLREIYIQNNTYTQLDFKAFEQKDGLTEIHLVGDNMFSCGCDTTFWMSFVSNRFNISFFGGACETPMEDNEIAVTDMTLYNCTQRFSYMCFQGHNCTNEQVCVDTLDSFRCECTGGLRNDTDPITGAEICVDIDECNDTNTCEQNCFNNVGSFTCGCNAGFRINETVSTRCVDIDECNDTNTCEQNCSNNVGSFTCGCNAGFRINETVSTRCVDIDECNDTNTCEQNCSNNVGSFTCGCNAGFRINETVSTRCVDIDECNDTNTCEQNCFNNVGSFTCGCNAGFRINETVSTRCVDIDECNDTNTCEQNCFNNVGSFTCGCNAGFSVNETVSTRCVDIDECEPPIPQPCREEGNITQENLCRNNIGSFICVCRSGFNNQADPTNCVDINECEASNDCNQTCVNIPGDYNCTCSPGFQFNFNGTRVLAGNSTTGDKGVPCVDIDECSINNTCEQNCSNTFGSFICSCNQGFNLTNVTRCVNINECELNSTLCDLERGMQCNDTIGSFECICLVGHVLDTMDNTTCVPIPTILPIALIAGTSSVAVFVIGAIIIIAVVIILIYLIWIRSRRSAKLKRKDSEDKLQMM